MGKVSKVELLGSNATISFVQNDKGLTITPDKKALVLSGIVDQSLASGSRVLRITHDKGWFNDDDRGVIAPGWLRQCNLSTGDFNNDLTFSDTPGDVWTSSFTGKSISVIAPKETGSGKIEIKIDGKTRAIADLSTSGARLAQQVVYKVSDLNAGKHSINIINRSSDKVAIDALIVR